MHSRLWSVLHSSGGLELAFLIGAAYLLLLSWWCFGFLRGYLDARKD